ncbi:MAG: tyrosine--tRNA ligase [Acidimicrobiia bacterium]
MDLLADFEARGLIHETTDRDALSKRLAEGPIGVYVGFDPTADSLHVGHLMGQIALRRVQLAGHRPYPLAGGATGMVGDPGGRSEERNLLDAQTLAHNVSRIKGQLERILDFEPGPYQAKLVDNATWTAPVSMLDFLRDVGKHVTVNQMLAKDSVRSRIESEHGISYTEFSYMLLQGNDFRHLCQHENVEWQMGGSDQWGNITLGIDLVRRALGRPAYGLVWPLLTKADGSKMGKSVGGAVWLDPAKTSPYQFHQYWLQTDDDTIATWLKRLTLLPLDDIAGVMADHSADPGKRVAQRRLADELTTMVHGAAATDAAKATAAVLFEGDPTSASAAVLADVAREAPCTELPASALDEGVVALLVRTGLASSNGDARRGLGQGVFRLNGVVLTPASVVNRTNLLHSRFLLLRKGRKTNHLVVVS